MTARARRHALFTANLAIALALFVIGNSVLRATTDGIMQGVEGLGSETIIVGDRNNGFVNSASGTGLTKDTLTAMRDSVSFRFEISGAARTFGEVISGEASETASTYFIEPNFFDVTRIKLTKGRLFSPVEEATNDDVCLISQELARRIEYRSTLVSDGHSCRIVGLVSSSESIPGQSIEMAVYKPLAALRAAESNGTSSISSIFLRAKGDIPAKSDIAMLTEHLPPEADPERMIWIGQEYWAAKKEIADGLWLLMISLSVVLIGMASAGLANSLIIDVMSRRAEIGLRIALGATQGNIFAMILREGLTIALLGGCTGVLTGLILVQFVIAPLVNVSFIGEHSAMVLDFWSIAIAMGVLGLSGVTAAVLPARQATRIDPSLALRDL